MKKIILLLTMVTCLFCSGVKVISANTFKRVIKKDKLVVVDFFALWCGPCRQYLPVLESVAQSNADVDFYKINIDGSSEKRLKNSLNVKMIPTLLFFRDGVEVHRVVGRLPEGELMNTIRDYKG